MFFEDPLRSNSFDAMAEVERHIDIPIAAGEQFTEGESGSCWRGKAITTN
jgi:L-alanine-DL-glutamate epimerase-like enolase superfamily enzyme